MAVGRTVARTLVPAGLRLAPQALTGVIREAVNRAVTGVGRFPGARRVAESRLGKVGGDVDRAVHDLIEQHVRLAGMSGFVTNLGGIATLPVTIPANIAGLAVLQARMVAAIAHLRGYDVDDPRVRTAVLACLLGEDAVGELLRAGRLPASPRGLLTLAVDPGVEHRTAVEVATELVAKVSGRRMVTTLGRRVPGLGGGVAAVTDAVATYHIGRYADREWRGAGR